MKIYFYVTCIIYHSFLLKISGHLLDDQDLIKTLEQSKAKSLEIYERVTQSEETEKKLNMARKRYLPVCISYLNFFNSCSWYFAREHCCLLKYYFHEKLKTDLHWLFLTDIWFNPHFLWTLYRLDFCGLWIELIFWYFHTAGIFLVIGVCANLNEEW